MNQVLALFHSMLSGSSFDRFQAINGTQIVDIPGISALSISEQNAQNTEAINRIIAAKKGGKSFFLIFEAVPKRAKIGYKLLAIPAHIDVPNEEGTTYTLYPNLNDRIQINPTIIGGNYGMEGDLTLGDSELYRQIILETPLPLTDSWEPWFIYALHIFQETCKHPLNNISVKIENLLKKTFSLQCYLAVSEANVAVGRIDSLYKALLSESKESLAHTALPKGVTHPPR